MGKLAVTIGDELDKELRVAIAQKGGKHGDLRITIEEAIRLWLINEKKKETRKYENFRGTRKN